MLMVAVVSSSPTRRSSQEGRVSVWPSCRIWVLLSAPDVEPGFADAMHVGGDGGQLDLLPGGRGAAAAEEVPLRDQLIVAHIGLGQLFGHQRGQFGFPIGIGQGKCFDGEGQAHFLAVADRVERQGADLVQMATAVEVVEELGDLSQVAAAVEREGEPLEDFGRPFSFAAARGDGDGTRRNRRSCW